ncbi:MAG TPA: DUF177 domain-containing protein [Xanthobacteraceae bacterium]|nr:DUF177 domain-containing protein [Xanthobacteraceae bacterium]
MNTLDLPWSVPVRLADIPEEGRRYDLAADEAARERVAGLIGLRALPRLEANFHVMRRGAHGLHVNGSVSATVGQTCVVTLDPIENNVSESLDLSFAPPNDLPPTSAQADPGGSGEEDAPEPLIGETIDLGAIATEFLILGVDPYPRKAGATFEPPAAEDGKANPFAALAALKKGQGRNDV